MYLHCPYCNLKIELVKINCGIFRCGIYQLKNGKFRQLPKHGTEKRIKTIISKHKDESFLLPTTDKLKPEVPKLLESLDIKWKRCIFYKTVISDLSSLSDVTYDVLVFFSPSGIESLFHNFPEFKQNGTKIAVFGSITKKAVEEKGLNVDIYAPSPKFPSMTMALDNYISKKNKK